MAARNVLLSQSQNAETFLVVSRSIDTCRNFLRSGALWIIVRLIFLSHRNSTRCGIRLRSGGAKATPLRPRISCLAYYSSLPATSLLTYRQRAGKSHSLQQFLGNYFWILIEGARVVERPAWEVCRALNLQKGSKIPILKQILEVPTA
jgi:hypothetical protein